MSTTNQTLSLEELLGPLTLKGAQEKKDFDRLSKYIEVSKISQPRSSSGGRAFEKSDAYDIRKVAPSHLKNISRVVKAREASSKKEKYVVHKREQPFISNLLSGSMPEWANGAKPEASVGPFVQLDSRQVWFDFYPILTFSKLFFDGDINPALLFKPAGIRKLASKAFATASEDVKEIRADLKRDVKIKELKLKDKIVLPTRGTTITLGKGSIWIQSKYLADGAPGNGYTGLTIKGGTISFSKKPISTGSSYKITATTKVAIELELDQPAGPTHSKDKFGQDAKDMKLKLSETLAFHFTKNAHDIDKIAPASWGLYGHGMAFNWGKATPVYNAGLSQILIPLKHKPTSLEVQNSNSAFCQMGGKATIAESYWGLPVAEIDVSKPSAAAGIGGLLLRCKQGLNAKWANLKGAAFPLQNPWILGAPGALIILDENTKNQQARQKLILWPDKTALFQNSVELSFEQENTLVLAFSAEGQELVQTLANADFDIDRPVKVDALPPEVKSKNSLLMMSVSKAIKLVYLLDTNMLEDALKEDINNLDILKPISLALSNALFKVSKPNGCVLFGNLSSDFLSVISGNLFLTFGLYNYIPTLPDPYAANLGVLRRSLNVRDVHGENVSYARSSFVGAIQNWLVSRTQWEAPEGKPKDVEVKVSFHFAFGANQFSGINLQEEEAQEKGSLDNSKGNYVAANSGKIAASRRNTSGRNTGTGDSNQVEPNLSAYMMSRSASSDLPPDYRGVWDKATVHLQRDNFALLDVSSNADLLGISFDVSRGGERDPIGAASTQSTNAFPLSIEGMDVVSPGQNVKTFTVPQISWEPLINLTPSAINGDPDQGYNYYPDDGGPMRIVNNGEDTVALAPIPLTDYLFENFKNDTQNFTAKSLLTLPFGLKALAVLQNTYRGPDENGQLIPRKGTEFLRNSEKFENEVRGGRQIQLNAGKAYINGESDMFVGSTIQLNNVLDFTGNGDGDSTLGKTVTEIFNDEFLLNPYDPERQRGVPLTRIDLSGYGASTFSNWLNPTAAFASTSQAKFDIMLGRTSHEIIQVKSIIYPWAIKVVRTITIFRVGSGYVYRFDSGWRAESNGNFDFRYFVNIVPDDKTEMDSPFEIHPGIIKGLYNVQNIEETEEIAFEAGTMTSPKIVNGDGLYVDNPAADDALNYRLQPVYFDADIEIEDATAGFVEKTIDGKKKNVVASKRIVGYVQSAPRGIPITPEILRNLVVAQLGSIGGGIDCEVNLAKSTQKMRLNRFDFSNSVGSNGSDIVFALAGRGSVMLPKEGSWTMVQHEAASGEVTPVPPSYSIPIIREGKVVKDGDLNVKIDKNPNSVLIRMANPSELLKAPSDDTINFGILQSTDTQKALFLNPSFEQNKKKLFSKTPPLFVDAFRIVNSKSIFPNIGDAITDFGEAVQLKIENASPFDTGALTDLGETVSELMDISDVVDGAKQQAFKLLRKAGEEAKKFDLPPTEFELINVDEGTFRIYIEYKNNPKDKSNANDPEVEGELEFDIDSIAQGVADTWKSRMGNIGLVLDLAGISRLMTIRGSWDSAKGSEPSYPKPKLEFADELQPVIDILEILQQIQTQDYAGAVAGGLKLAMSNKAGSWEYKFEASKEIPVLRFPPTDVAYNDPNCPFKLEAGLKVGAYFNAALMVNSQGAELLPSAGGFLGFYARLSVMCVSVSAATVYALGQVNMDIAADTAIGPSLRMKFGFGAQIVVGLPVAGNVSVLFVVGVEIFAASGIIEVSGSLLFEGHAEILGGIVAITIRIEAKGTVSKKTLPGEDPRTDMACQVTFGLDISIAFIINISFSESWQEQRQIA
ncbi:hypothetical protein [Owenweeksia hongkongensis]|uniref:hypothetical protein n=1 Tax=Owenweeksia hongkongensis TaxID=253245 RepID=UPI003A94F8EF